MRIKNKNFLSVLITLCLILNLFTPIFAVNNECKYCDFSHMYVGEDKYENFNRKMFNLNSRLNKYIARPVHILWSSLIPKYGLDRIQSAYLNIEYPKRLASCLLQKDFKGAKSETKRFLTNTTLGLGGLYDPADKLFKIKPVNENMDQALCKCKMKSGSYLVMPILNTCTPRSLLGRAIEAALDPSVYLASPITSLVKFGFFVNKTSYMQPLAKMIESTYADPYDIAKKLYGMENYIKASDLDREDLLSTDAKLVSENSGNEIIANVEGEEQLSEITKNIEEIKEEENSIPDELAEGSLTGAAANLTPDIVLSDFKAQSPVVDSMRTALFDAPNLNKSIWNELSIWNRSFANRVKTSSVNIVQDRDDYKFRYILQRNRTAPLAIINPSIGEGINSHHSVVFAKMFYDEGYSVVILGSHFQWEFAKSMPKGYCPGMPSVDADYLKLVTSKVIENLQEEHNCKFENKVMVGTSFGAMATLFIGAKESQNNTLGVNKFIAISPPIELVYAMSQADKNSEQLDMTSPEAKHKTAITAAKIIQITKLKESPDFNFSEMPFTEDEGKLIVSFLMRQKLSDLIFTLEGASKTQKSDIYNSINNINYQGYVEKYLLAESGATLEDISFDTSLYSIADYLKNSDNYKIYHSLDDFFVNKKQIERLKLYSPSQVVCLNNGSHLGFLYRKEFLDSFKKDILISDSKPAEK